MKEKRMVALPANDTQSDMTRSYVERVMRIPMLTLEEEQRFARAWRDARDQAARDRIVNAHLRVAVKCARQFAGYGVPMDDLIDEGAIGLGRALDKFDPDRGFRFSTYATWWVRAAIVDYVLRTSRLTPMGTTSDAKKLFFGLRRAKARLGILDETAMNDDEVAAIAEATGTSAASVVEMDARMRPDASLNAVDPETGSEMIDRLQDGGPMQDEIVAGAQERDIRLQLLGQALEDLAPRERHVVEGRRLMDPVMTLEDLAGVYGVSRERIRQIEIKAVARLEKRILELARMRRYVPLAA